jgi:hypothetical protein
MTKRKPAPAKGPTDTERLDWLEANPDVGRSFFYGGVTFPAIRLNTRAAIDAAMARKGSGKP